MGTAIRVTDIRANRKSPGLRAQHLCGLRLVAQLCSGQLDNMSAGNTRTTGHTPQDALLYPAYLSMYMVLARKN